MKSLKYLAMCSLIAVFAAPIAEAKGKGNNRQIQERIRKEKERKEKERAAKKKEREEIDSFMEPRDTNHDGSLSREEFLSEEKDKADGEAKFDQFNKNKDRYLSKGEIEEMLGLGK